MTKQIQEPMEALLIQTNTISKGCVLGSICKFRRQWESVAGTAEKTIIECALRTWRAAFLFFIHVSGI